METGIIVESGGTQGIYAAGILDVLSEHGIKADGLTGVSASAIYECSFVAGQTGRSIRHNLKYCRDPRYMSFRPLVTTDGPVEDELYYHELPERLDLFDSDAFEASPMELYATCADIETGRPVYHRYDSLRGENIQWVRTSASMPLVPRIVGIDGHKLLDGGVSDFIPAAVFHKMGFGRSLVVLTRPDDYCKKPSHMLPTTRGVYRRYPELIKTMEYRHLIYNRRPEEVGRMEAAREIFVMRPSCLIKISRTKDRPERIQQMYELGHLDRMKALRDIVSFSGMGPTVCG